ncbi:MAG: substrate-binding domain-containing protein [Clostridia bacterium]|nr:substrate-binding domain-containing protein [Clostridia bacterium]
MKQIRKLICAGIAACLLLTATACSNTDSGLPELSSLGQMTILSREDGSGTKTEFENLIGTDAAGINKLAVSTDEMMSLTAADKNAIGYLAYSAISNIDYESVKALTIDGVAPSASSIKNGKYPLCRNYYLAYLGDLRDVQTDFLAYIMSAGQDIVSKTCIPIKSSSSFLSDKSAGTITIAGSSSAAPLLQELADAYSTYNPNAEITIEVTDSASGLNAAIRGACDFAMSSRSLEDYEAELLNTKIIAADGIAIIVNQANPLENLTSKQLQSIYNGEFAQWGDMN